MIAFISSCSLKPPFVQPAASVTLGSEPTLPVSISQLGVEWLLFEN